MPGQISGKPKRPEAAHKAAPAAAQSSPKRHFKFKTQNAPSKNPERPEQDGPKRPEAA